MAWQSKFAAGFSKPLIRQMVGILNRDMRAALDNVSGAPGTLGSFAEWDLATVATENFPACVIVRLFVAEHAYEDLRRTRQGLFETSASLTVVAELEET